MSLSEIENYRNLILENIEYDYLKQRVDPYCEDLDEIVELMVETVCAKRKTTRIAGADFPHEVVRSRFLKLDSSHIEFVMECLHKNTTQVRNIKQYLLAVLFNAPTNAAHLRPQVAFIRKTPPLSCGGEGLARESAGEDGDGFKSCFLNKRLLRECGDVPEFRHIRPMLLQDGIGIVRPFALTDRFKTRCLRRQV